MQWLHLLTDGEHFALRRRVQAQVLAQRRDRRPRDGRQARCLPRTASIQLTSASTIVVQRAAVRSGRTKCSAIRPSAE
jgi:hypothetical protein